MRQFSLREMDELEIGYIWQGAALTRPGSWLVLRRGFPRSNIRILYSTQNQEWAVAKFATTLSKMRQGMLALVNPAGTIINYASERR